MKNLLITTALVATAGMAQADNFKTQLDSVENSFQCQNHFERGDAIAGNIDKFEFCVWYLNNNREAFFRDLHYYDLLPTGDILAVKATDLRTKQSAEKAINAFIQKIIDAKVAEAKAAAEADADKRINAIVEKADEAKEALEDELNAKIKELTEALATKDVAHATAISELVTAHMTEISDLETAISVVEEMLDSSKMDFESVSEKHQTHPTCLLYTSPSPRDS